MISNTARLQAYEQKSVSGIFIGNHEALVMGACTIRNDFVPDSFDAEARAAIHGLRFARDMVSLVWG